MPNIVISYRREDTRWIVGRIFDRLKQHYGRDNVFMDIDAVPLGLDYRDHIRNTLERSDIVLAVIGPQWLGLQSAGQPRITDETDWVRIEIEAALGRKIPLIPILIDRTPLPKLDELPEKVRDLAFRQAISIDTGRDFDTHTERLIREMDQLLGQQKAAPKPAVSEEPPKVDDVDQLAEIDDATTTVTNQMPMVGVQKSTLLDLVIVIGFVVIILAMIVWVLLVH
jgi:TIR domain